MSAALKHRLLRLWNGLALVGGWLRGRPGVRHLGPLAILASLHVAVTERGLRSAGGLPVRAIPYDFVDSYSRFLAFISDSLRGGALPIWYPYGHAGTPFLVNPQSQLWNPLTWLLAIVPGYSLLLAQRQLLLTILWGSFGVYFLAYSLWHKRSAALLGAIAFNFTSARLCNAEHMDIVAAFSVFPWVFWAIKYVAQGKRWAMPVLGMLLGLLVVAGYPGVVLLSPLWFGAWAAWLFATDCNDRASRRRFVVWLSLAGLLGIAISSGYWLPIATNLGAFSRGVPLDTDAALAQGLLPADLLHLVFGTPITLAPSGATTDPSMRGLYFGIVALLLAFYALLARRDRTVTALGVGFVFALLMSMGRIFFLRVALHDWVSSMNLSRFPAGDSRAVAVLAGSLLAAAGVANLLDNPDERRRLSRILTGGLVTLLLGVVFLGGIIHPGVAPAVMNNAFTSVLLLEILVVGLAWIGTQRFSTPLALAVCLVAVSGLDGGIHAVNQTGMWSVPPYGGVVRSRDVRSSTFDPSKALVPRVDAKSLIDVGANDGFLDKKFYLAAYSPFMLKRFEALLAAGFRNFLVNGKRVVGFTGVEPPAAGAAFEQRAIPVQFQITRYLPDRVDYTVDVPVRTTLVFNEVYFPGWKARVDGRSSQAMTEVSGGLRALTVEAGHHTIATRYSPWSFWLGLSITLLAWAFSLAWLLRATVWAGFRPGHPDRGPILPA